MRRLLVTLLIVALMSACSSSPNPAANSRRRGTPVAEKGTDPKAASDGTIQQIRPSSTQSRTEPAPNGDERHPGTIELKGPTAGGQYEYRDTWENGSTTTGFLNVTDPQPSSYGPRQLHFRGYQGDHDSQSWVWSPDALYLRSSDTSESLCNYEMPALFVPNSLQVGEKWHSEAKCNRKNRTISRQFVFMRSEPVQVEDQVIPTAVIRIKVQDSSNGASVDRTIWFDFQRGLILKSRTLFQSKEGAKSTLGSQIVSVTPKPIEE